MHVMEDNQEQQGVSEVSPLLVAYNTIDLEIFVLQNFHMTNFCVKNFS